MDEKKTKITLPNGTVVDAVEVEVLEATERWTDIKLADGTSLRIKPVVLSVIRVEGQYDQEGDPVYQMKANQVMTASVPEHLKKGANASKSTH